MKIGWLGFLLLFAACSSGGLQQRAASENGKGLPATDLERVQEGVVAPDFTLESKDDESITLSHYRGNKNVVLVFFRGYW